MTHQDVKYSLKANFSGAMEAWLADALADSGFKDQLEPVLAKGQIVEGAAMLSGSVTGGIIAQATNLGVPYVIRVALLVLNFMFAFVLMKDIGFKPADEKNPIKEIKIIVGGSIRHGLRNSPVRWIMLAAPFSGGVTIYAFYAMQPYLLQLWGNEKAYGVAGLAAAIVAGAQIAGGLVVPYVGKVFRRRTSVLLTCEGQRSGAGSCWFGAEFLGGGDAIDFVGFDVFSDNARTADISQRADPVPAARDCPVVRLAFWIKWWRRLSTATGQSC